MVSGPGVEEGEHLVRAVEISSAVRAVQCANGGGWWGGTAEVAEEKSD